MQLTWTEITTGIGSAPSWSLAGRGDGPETTAGGAVAALIQTASAATNSWSVERAINGRKEHIGQRLRQRFRGHANGGILVVAGIVHQHHGELFSYLNDFRGIYARPEDALSVWRGERRMETPGTRHRFFWVTVA